MTLDYFTEVSFITLTYRLINEFTMVARLHKNIFSFKVFCEEFSFDHIFMPWTKHASFVWKFKQHRHIKGNITYSVTIISSYYKYVL
jgi:hypothetical protein